MNIPHQSNPKPVYILVEGKRKLAVTDGKGNAYETLDEPYAAYEGKYDPNKLIDPNTYEFERFLSGMDF